MNNPPDIRYSECYVAYLDILGFKDLVLSDRPDNQRKIATYLALSKSIIDGVEKMAPEPGKISAMAISDSIILSVPFASDNSENISDLRDLCVQIREIQFQLAEINIWLRGGISFGNAYFDSRQKQIIGPAYINAYRLEQEVALYPRVVIDSKLVGKLGVESARSIIDKVNFNNGEYCPLKGNVLFGWHSLTLGGYGLERDTPLFIDYLAYCFSDNGKLDKIISNIEERIYTSSDIHPKYRWLVNYLIASCYHHINFLPKIDPTHLHAGLKRLQRL